jgi:hypothetical protein
MAYLKFKYFFRSVDWPMSDLYKGQFEKIKQFLLTKNICLTKCVTPMCPKKYYHGKQIFVSKFKKKMR